MIKRMGSRFQLWTKSGSRPLGPVTTKKAAVAQEQAIRIAKAQRGTAAKKKR